MEDSVLIMDNASIHKTNEVKSLLELSGFDFLYLPPYSPFLNPIENMFSKWKEHVKRGNPINEVDLFNLISQGATLISSTDTDGYYMNMIRYIVRSLNREVIVD
ncbi:Insertion element IS630 uncharacterized 39 kDa protein [Cucumispora dikerogammari]|nr:Insertion element IS630 uncharacterized 39 kDa protein [Cucumispora dikerogammari]